MEYKALFKEYKRLIKHFDQNNSMEKWREDVRALATTDGEKVALIDYLNFRKRRLNVDLDQQWFSITIVVMIVLLARYTDRLILYILVPLMAIRHCMSMNRELKKMFYRDCIEVLADSVSKNET